MMEIHKYNLDTHREIIEAYFEDNDQGITWVDYLNHNPYLNRFFWYGVPVYTCAGTPQPGVSCSPQ